MHLADGVSVVILCIGVLSSTRLALAEGSIGCLFKKALCKPKLEWCFDDYAFGRCVPRYDDEGGPDLYQYKLDEYSLQILKRELDRLIKQGYQWTHFYTQCVLKSLLFSFRYQKEYNEDACSPLLDDSSMSYYDDSFEIDPKSIGKVRFTPSVVDPHAEYADEIYIPVFGKEDIIEDTIIPVESIKPQDAENYEDDLRRAMLLTQINENKRGKGRSQYDIFNEDELENEILPDYLAYLRELAKEETSDISPFSNYIEPTKNRFFFKGNYDNLNPYPEQMKIQNKNLGNDDEDDDLTILEDIFENDRNILKSFSRNYNTPEKFRNGHETKDEVFFPKSNEVYSKQPKEVYYPEERQLAYDNYISPKNDVFGKNKMESGDGVYTEGGVVYLKDEEKGEPRESNSIKEIMNGYSSSGFKRPERLDVKKPGPSFSTNNYAFQKESSEVNKAEKEEHPKPNLTTKKPLTVHNVVVNQLEKKKGGSPMESPSLRKQTTTMQPLKEKEPETEDPEYGYIVLKNKISSWQEGSKIIRKVEDMLKLSPNTFSGVRVDQNEIRFKVNSNRQNLNASDIIKKIEVNKDSVQRAIGAEVVSVGIRDQNHVPTSINLLGGDERQLWILSFLLCGVIAAAAIVGAAFFIIKRHPHSREKIQNLSQFDSEASKDYQDLCRARMATKMAQEKSDSNTPGHRVTNLGQAEAPNHSPSSRSSTSSWSEEPALTNMDISTGHMVLSYMEDHLKNKDRLEQEWLALCVYEAEPCATTIVLSEENKKKNRYEDVLPYDHARVVLNELSNITGSDYINASTITDHDPRNPAYIATQGPLPVTTPDFWQMVWEQGSVVMVMLTRLTENGTTMCHRYWPEEGSELYHIYEVHLVSEHIWCDDYLVRSFYLKNIKTGETRTVTQFHFLSWPENGIPISTKALLEFRRKVNKSYRGRSCPVIVHCSDGVGRTGTYCLIDMVLNRMAKGAKEIDIAATLEHIRDQRPLMVRTKQQFEFVLMAVAEEVHAILKALPANPNHSPPPVVKEKE